MQLHDIKTLQAAGHTVPGDAPRHVILKSVANTIRALPPGVTFKSLVDVEFMSEPQLRTVKIGGTVMEMVAVAAEAVGVAIGDPKVPVGQRTLGDMMDSKLDLSAQDLDTAVCHCAQGPTMTAERAAGNMDLLAQGAG